MELSHECGLRQRLTNRNDNSNVYTEHNIIHNNKDKKCSDETSSNGKIVNGSISSHESINDRLDSPTATQDLSDVHTSGPGLTDQGTTDQDASDEGSTNEDSSDSSPAVLGPLSADFLSMPGLALDKLEELARHGEEFARMAWDGCTSAELAAMTSKARSRAEFIAKQAEEMARYAWTGSTSEFAAMRGRAKERAELVARHAEELARYAWTESTSELVAMGGKARECASIIAAQAREKAEEIARQAWLAGSTVLHHKHLPGWMRDNDFLVKGHRPQLNSFMDCFRSMFSIHTETGNIWTHFIGCVAFIIVATYNLTRPSVEVQWQEKAVFSTFFMGAILCLGFSFLFHTVHCHSERIGKLFSKLDYCGIALLIIGSFVPWLYYSFYCRLSPKITYLCLVISLGIGCIVMSMWDKFGSPKFRSVRAGVFVALGMTAIIPMAHYVIAEGFYHAVNYAALGWLGLVGLLYISGALIYAMRFPECMWPGRFDIWFQSHQIFHVFVVAAAFIHYHGINTVAHYRLNEGACAQVS